MIIAANPELHERELAKLAHYATAITAYGEALKSIPNDPVAQQALQDARQVTSVRWSFVRSTTSPAATSARRNARREPELPL